MDRKYIIIAVVAIIAVLAIGIGYTFLSQSGVEYEKINLSKTASMEVPKAADTNFTKDSNGIRMYTCPSKSTAVTSYNSKEDLSLVGAGAYAVARDTMLNGSTDVEKYNGYDIKENTVNGVHYYIVSTGNDATHDNIVIGSADLNVLKHMLDSLTFKDQKKASDNTTDGENETAATAQTEDVKTADSQKGESSSQAKADDANKDEDLDEILDNEDFQGDADLDENGNYIIPEDEISDSGESDSSDNENGQDSSEA